MISVMVFGIGCVRLVMMHKQYTSYGNAIGFPTASKQGITAGD